MLRSSIHVGGIPETGMKQSISFRSFFIPMLILLAVTGVSAGIGIFTFVYARGFSYLSDDPEACHNCHIMNSVFESWSKGGHQHVAVCNDCHVPHNFIGKWYTKANNGMHHSFAFTFLDIPLAIQPRQSSKDIAQQNCLRCHSDLFQHMQKENEFTPCISCHRQVGHFHN